MNPVPKTSRSGLQRQNNSVLPATRSISGGSSGSVHGQQTMGLQQHVQYQTQQQQSEYRRQHQQIPQQQILQVQSHQQHLPHLGLNGGWQTDQDVNDRRKMIDKIVHLLQQRKPNAPPDWLKKLPQMAKRLEESLYRSAPSFQAYNDTITLKQRLQQLAMNIGGKLKRNPSQLQPLRQQLQLHQQQQHNMVHSSCPLSSKQQQSHKALNQTSQQVIRLQSQQVQCQLPQKQVITSSQSSMSISLPQTQMPPQQVQQPTQRLINMSDINPINAGSSQPYESGDSSQSNTSKQGSSESGLSQVVQGIYTPQSSFNDSAHVNSVMTSRKFNGNFQGTSLQSGHSNSMNAQNTTTSTNIPRTNSDRQQVLRHQQQRLLLLRHAAKCPHEDGRCPVTPHCAGMKRLWKHIAECKDQKCLVPHCVSSRYVLSHYHRCKDVRCPVCGPVREAIHRSHEKQKQMQDLKQRHQEAIHRSDNNASLPIPGHANNNVSSVNVSVSSLCVRPSNSQSLTRPSPVPIHPISSNDTTHAPVVLASAMSSQSVPSCKKPKIVSNHLPLPATAVQIVPLSMLQSNSNKSCYPISNLQAPHRLSESSIETNNVNKGMPMAVIVPNTDNTISQVAISSHGIDSTSYKVPKPQEDHTLINCFTIDQIEMHISSLNKGLQLSLQKLKSKTLEVLKLLQSHQHGWVFNSPVNPVELGLPDYFEVIKQPMDLGTIKKRLENNVYTKIEAFESDINLTFENAMLYNPEGSVVYNMAHEMKDRFKIEYKNLIDHLEVEENEKRKKGEACALCGSEKLSFEPPVFYCNGLNCRCSGNRIARNRSYYVGGNNQYHWCQQCYGELKDNQDITVADRTLRKTQLTKKRNDEQPEESWVQCDRCQGWIHQICGLFNTRQNKDQRSEYVCPRCTVDNRKKHDLIEGTSSAPMAEELQRTNLSESLEGHVRKKVNAYFEKAAKERAKIENISIGDARKGLSMGGPITIRQVTSMDRKFEVRERMIKRYEFKNYPIEFNFRCKCIIVFQNLDGVDVILFGLYVYEHDEKNPPPNKRAVYISYLDSVHYMRPKKMRTYIYHEILIAYLDYVRRKGFATAHIWACPPLKGDDYILYAKPPDQKTPRDDRLRQWYIDMLTEAQKRGIVGKVTNMYDLYFADFKNDATVVPYMDGDYFPNEVETIIKDIEEGRNTKKCSNEEKKKKTKSKNKTKSGRGGTRSTGLDEDILAASGIFPVGYDQNSLEEGYHDYVMAKLGETIKPMKESFIVAYLAWDGANEDDMNVPNDILEYRQKNGITNFFKLHTSKNRNSQTTFNSQEYCLSSDCHKNEFKGPVDKVAKSDINVCNNEHASQNGYSFCSFEVQRRPKGKTSNDREESQSTNEAEDAQESLNVSAQTTLNGSSIPVKMKSRFHCSSPNMRDGKYAAMAARKRRINGKIKPNFILSSAAVFGKSTVKDNHGRLVKILNDDKEEMDCEFLNNRQAFLNLCQGNHYQFDQLRRAKHSSMMVLWHLHNRDAPKFVQQCAVCSREIITGYRYYCGICGDYDQCHECFSSPKNVKHPHDLKPIPVANGQPSEMTEAQRKERQRSIQLHMNLLLHAATCVSPKCRSHNCSKMKGLLKHGSQCQVKGHGGCAICKRIWALLQIHAKKCKDKKCPVPHCMAIRERFLQLTKKQQAMDDRRRQEMNRHYGSIR